MPPLKLPFMFSPIYRINVIADVCHGKTLSAARFARLLLSAAQRCSVHGTGTQLQRRTCGSAVLCDEICVISPAGIPVAAFSNLLLAQISLGSGKKARERARVKICPTRRAAMRATMCVFGEIDIFLFLLFSFLARSSLFSRDSFLKPFGVRNETPRFVH